MELNCLNSTGATVFTNGNIAAGIVTATSFVGDGSALTGVGASEKNCCFIYKCNYSSIICKGNL